MRSSTTFVTAHALARETGSAERHIQKWMESEAVKTRKDGGRALYHRDQALAAISLHQRPKEDHEPAGVDALSAELTRLRRANELAGIALATLLEGIERVEGDIKKNCPADEPVVVPEKCPSFTAEQAAWLVVAINRPVSELRQLMPKEGREA